MSKLCIVLIALALICAQGFQFHASNSITRKTSLFAKQKAIIPENETDDEMRDRLRTKARKMMFNENGVAYAPWVARQLDEDAIVEDLMKKEKGQKSKKATSILDRGEVETSEGMKWRMTGSQVDLAWVTNSETDNRGYIVEKRPSYGGDFQEVASYKEVASLVSKGPNGGRSVYSSSKNCV
jgi:hypothetical protein